MKSKYIFVIILALIFMLITIIMSITKNSYDNDCMFKKFPDFLSSKNHIEIFNLISPESYTNMEKYFPYSRYLDSDNWKNVNSIRADLIILDSLNSDPFGNINIISTALTNKMQIWNTDNLDSLNLLLNWTERFNTESVFSDKYDILYQSVYNYWISFISQRLDEINQSDYSIKFNCKFHFLRMRCCQMAGACGDRDNNSTKAIRHLIEKDWFYLCNRFWIGTSLFFKSICISFGLITLYGYVCIIQKHKIK